MPAIPPHNTAVVDKPWDGPGSEAKIANDAGAAVLRQMYAWVDPSKDKDTKAAYKLSHHEVSGGKPGAANINGVRNAMSRIPQMRPRLSAADEAGVKDHLQRHLDAFHKNGGEQMEDAPAEGARALIGGEMEIRSSEQDEERGLLGTLVGYLAVFNEWTEIDSAVEGHFLERIAPGAFSKTFREGMGRIRCIFHHGNDPSVGVRVLGPVDVLEEREVGAWAEVPLLDTSYNRDLAPGIKAGLYGMSFRFRAVRQNMNRFPKPSSYNPKAIAERTLTELAIPEFGPTPFAAYAGAEAGMRSFTDELLIGRLASDPRKLEELARRSGIVVPRALAEAENDDVKCQACGEMNADDAVYCDQCGAKLADPGGAPYTRGPDENVECPDCGKFNEEDAAYCDQCGAELPAEGESVALPLARETTRAAGRAGAPLRSRVVTDSLFRRSVQFAVDHPWEMQPQALSVLFSILQERVSGQWPSAEEVKERLGIRADSAVLDLLDPEEEEQTSPVSIIPIYGPIIPRGDMMSNASGLTSVAGIQTALREALANPKVEAILFDVDSPGGSSAMIPELTAELAAARGQKPMTAVANTLMASAAYHLMAQVDKVYASPSADVGSIGVYASHTDLTKAMEQLGRKVTMVHSAGSPYKTEMQPFVELSPDAEEELQRRVDAVYDEFVQSVAAGRGTTVEDVNENYGKGRVLSATDALAVGMVDGIATFDQVLARLNGDAVPTPTSNGADSAASEVEESVRHPVQVRRGAALDPKTLQPKEAPRWRL